VSIVLFRGVAIFVLFLTTTICGMQVLGAVAATQQQNATDPNRDAKKNSDSSEPPRAEASTPVIVYYTPVVITLVAGVALATLLEGISRLSQLQHSPSETASSSNIRLFSALADLQTAITSLGAQLQSAVQPAPIQAAPVAQSPALELHMERMVKLLEEMKEVSMLDEAQRQTRRKQTMLRRKATRLEEAARHINRQNWEEADALLHLLESLHPGEPDVLACRNQLNDARIASQADQWDQLQRSVDELLSLSKYEEALLATTAFLDRFPSHPDCQQLAMRIRHDTLAHAEAVSNRMYEEIKSAVESRQWRAALDAIQRFLEQFPDHAKAAKIRNQVRVIQKNAEIEERHELEEKIRELISAKQYTEAADLSESVLSRFPESPQTAYLTELLPKLRERSTADPQEVPAT